MLRQTLRRICREQHVPPGTAVDIVLCSDHTIRRLNARYRHLDRATDVLSFNYGEPDLLGEIYVSLDRAAVQARRYAHPYRDELQRLAVHGMCHLLGHDHERRSERVRMERLERRYASV